ncbi:MAG: tryptophan-rich sensory protein [Candidatus Aenigmarchaeota archaeon]|nr:tryptophan-rich sensory protein [Candidatus Aenigmarchaeota archaeon]
MAPRGRSGKKSSKGLLTKVIVMVVVAELAGVIGSVFTLPAIGSWYASLVKPWFTPSSWVFGPVWTTLYALMGIAAGIVWHTKAEKRQTALNLYFGQLGLNVIWSLLFFGLRSPLYALGEIVVLWIAIALTIRAFYPISKNAAMLLVPYILWVTVATALNAGVWLLNVA